MRLSQMSTDQMEDAVVAIAVAAGAIIEDDKMREDVKALEGLMTGRSLDDVTAMVLLRTCPHIFRRREQGGHRDDVHAIIAALTGRTPEEVGGQNIMTTLREARESIDEELLSFFGWSGSSAPRTE